MPASEITAYSTEIGVLGGKSFAGQMHEIVGLELPVFGIKRDAQPFKVLNPKPSSEQILDPKSERSSGANFPSKATRRIR